MNTPFTTFGAVLSQEDFDEADVRVLNGPGGNVPTGSVSFGLGTVRLSGDTDMSVEQFAANLHNLADRLVLHQAAQSNHPEAVIAHALKAS